MDDFFLLRADEKERCKGRLSKWNAVRTGTPGDGDCFFHALNVALKGFREMGDAERTAFVSEQRRRLAEEFQRADWIQVQSGQLALLQISQVLRLFLCVLSQGSDCDEWALPAELADEDNPFLEYVAEHQDRWGSVIAKWIEDSDGLLEIWSMLFPHSDDAEELVANWVQNCPTDFDTKGNGHGDIWKLFRKTWQDVVVTATKERIQSFNDDISVSRDKDVDHIDEEMTQVICTAVGDAAKELIELCAQQTFEQMRLRIAECGHWVDVDLVMAMYPYLPYDIIFVRADTQEVFADTASWSSPDETEGSARNVLVMLYFPDSHFENLGQFSSSPNDPRQKLVRVFPPDNEFVRFLRATASQPDSNDK